jgi:hypothetical protein
MSGFNVNDPGFQETPSSLVFNKREAGVVTGVKIKVVKKTSKDPENSPDYKVFAWDKNQITNTEKIEDDKIYPVNKGYYYQNEFKSEQSKGFFVRDLRNLLRSVNHPADDKGNFLFEKEFKDYNDFMDYVMAYVNNAIKKDPLEFDVVVDYGDDYKASKFLRLNGFPHWICKSGVEKLSLSRNAIIVRPKADSKEEASIPSTSINTDWTD